jgi:hypothetical protein
VIREEIGNATLYNGDCLEAMQEISAFSAKAIITANDDCE